MSPEYKVVIYNAATAGNDCHYNTGETRYCVVSTETGEILDDAQGYGYKTIQNAYASYAYKNRDKQKDIERAKKGKHIRQWMKHHKDFVEAMDSYAFEIAKESEDGAGKLDAKLLKRMLADNNLCPDFTPGELLKVWRSR